MDASTVELRPKIVIEGLPDHIKEVPRSPLSPEDPFRYERAAAWQKWREEVIRYRIMRRIFLEQNPEYIAIEMAICAKSWKYWVTMWCFIFEPRDADGQSSFNEIIELDEDGNVPEEENEDEFEGDTLYWVPFDRQYEFGDTIELSLRSKGALANVASSKSREVGASWVGCSFSLHKWLFAKAWTCLMLSRNEEFVDSEDPKSLFWKIMFLFDNLPPWMQPVGFDRRRHKTSMRLRHPTANKYIVGETANKNAGRGNRVTWAFMDEAAFFEKFAKVWAGLVNTTRHVCAVSSESIEMHDDFTRLVSGEVIPEPRLFPFDWWQCPYHLDEWLQDVKERFALEPWRFEQEVLRNARGGNKTYIYPQMEYISPPDVILKYLPGGGPFSCSIDPGQQDNTAIIIGQDSLYDGRFKVLEAYENNKQDAEFYASILLGVPFQKFSHLYGQREYEFMEFMRSCGVLPDFYGDVYGHTTLGAKTESFYDVLMDHGIYVNVDRTPTGNMTAMQNSHRFLPGRRDAVRNLIPRCDFSGSMGGRLVHKCLKNHKFAPIAPGSTVLSDEAIKDYTAHIAASFEYMAVNIRRGGDLRAANMARMTRAGAVGDNLGSGIVRL